jgi:quinol monooxygenase YgiN
MITVITTWTIKPGIGSVFSSVFTELASQSKNEPGCISYQVFQDQTNQTLFYVIAEWEDKAAFLQHRNSEAYHQADAVAAKMLVKEPDDHICELVL